MSKKKWTESELRYTFNLQPFYSAYPLLDTWLATDDKTTAVERIILQKRASKLREHVNYWNEEELKMHFVSAILDMIDFDDVSCNAYFEREISGSIDGIRLYSETDYMLASGIGELIKAPYFCFHEYKRKKRNPDDPVAQVLVAMLLAQLFNNNQKPIYGCHIIGEMWYFMVMQDKEYAIAKALDASDAQDLYKIVSILRAFKEILMRDLIL